MAKCLVTGASGFIGKHLVRALVARGDQVTCLVRRTSQLASLDGLPVRFVQGDVTAPDSLPGALADCDVIYHLAGLTKSLTYEALLKVNAGGVENLMRAAARLPNPPVVIFVSSLAAAGPAVDGRPREPHDVPAPISNYGKSKLAGEIVAAGFADEVPLSILRPPIVIGEEDLLSLDLFHSVSTFGVHLVPGFRTNRFSIVHATDLASALILAAERGRRVTRKGAEIVSSLYVVSQSCEIVPRAVAEVPLPLPADPIGGQGIYFPADQEMPTFAEIGQLIARGLGRRRVLCIPTAHTAAWVLAGLSELTGKLLRKPTSLNLDKVREAVAGSWIGSPRSANEDLRWKPAASLADRFRQTAEWYLREGWL